MSIEVALSKLRSAQICHPNAVQFLIDEAITAIQQAEVTNELLHPEDFNVEVVMKPVVGFAPVSTQGVRVTHKPTGISVTCDAARSQHTNRHHAFEQLRAILAQQPATPEPVGQVSDLFPSVRNKLHAKGFDSDAPLYTHPAPGVPRGAVNLGAHSLASELAQAVAQDDDDPEGHDMSAGLFGPTVSAWLRKVAADFLSHPAQGVPDGYVLMPVEPTQEMLQAGNTELIYAAMLAAAQAQKGQP